MTFGKRVDIRQSGRAAVVQETCVRCYGTGWIRERGSKIMCKSCKGSGRLDVQKKRAS
jgi:DnaJ-class molecular chaperone